MTSLLLIGGPSSLIDWIHVAYGKAWWWLSVLLMSFQAQCWSIGQKCARELKGTILWNLWGLHTVCYMFCGSWSPDMINLSSDYAAVILCKVKPLIFLQSLKGFYPHTSDSSWDSFFLTHWGNTVIYKHSSVWRISHCFQGLFCIPPLSTWNNLVITFLTGLHRLADM